MPKPAPEYIPLRIRDRVAALGKTFLSLSLELGFSRNYIYSFFQRGPLVLVNYEQLSRGLGLTLSQLSDLFSSGRISTHLKRMALERNCETPTALARELKVGPSFLLPIVAGESRGSILVNATKLAEALEMTIDELLEEYRAVS